MKKVKYVVTIEEGILAGGFGSAILELLNQNKIYKPVIRMGIPDEFIEQGTRNELLKECKLTSEDIIQTIKILKNRNRCEVNGKKTFRCDVNRTKFSI